jgi:hypothetical protein
MAFNVKFVDLFWWWVQVIDEANQKFQLFEFNQSNNLMFTVFI